MSKEDDTFGIPAIKITDTDIDKPIRVSAKPTLLAPEEDDGVRVILNKRPSEQRSIGHSSDGGSGSIRLDDRRDPENQATEISHLKSGKPKVTFKLWRKRFCTGMRVNLLLRYRTKFVTLTEIFLPVFVMFIFIASLTSHFDWTVGIRSKQEMAKIVLEGKSYKNMDELNIRKLFCRGRTIQCNRSDPFVFYTPNDDFTKGLMTRVAKKLKINPAAMKSLKNEGEVLELCKSRFQKESDKIEPVGVVFSNQFGETKEFPNKLVYAIRTFTIDIANTAEIFPFIKAPSEDHPYSPYITSGFVGLQNSIDKSYLDIIYELRKKTQRNEPTVPELNQHWTTLLKPHDVSYNLQMFPFTLFLDLKVRHYTWSSIMLSIVLGYFCTVFFSVRQVIIDSNSGILEILTFHGMSRSMYWYCILFHDVILRAIGCIFMTLIMYGNISSTGGLLEYDNPFLVWFFFFVHGVALTASCFTISVFFARPSFGGSFAFAISFLSYFIPLNLYTMEIITSRLANLILCLLFPNWTMANGIFHFLKFESFETGLGWKSLAVWSDEKLTLFPIYICLGIFFFQTAVYMSLTIYIDRVSSRYLFPRENYFFCWKKKPCCRKAKAKNEGVNQSTGTPIARPRKKKNCWKRFCRTFRCDCCKKKHRHGGEFGEFSRSSLDFQELSDDFIKPIVYEETQQQLTCKVKCRNLTHLYGDYQVALDDLSLNFYEDQITVILGNSGSGKTTLLHILAGLIAPTQGSARIIGLESAKNKQLRPFIGFCPQKLILFRLLSVGEHVRLICTLHSNSYKAAKKLSEQLLVRFNLWEYQRVAIKNLSEGQKRKMVIAMALATNPSILILDEPTLGMDPASKYEIWSTLRALRYSRTIIVTTSTMEEADAFGDKIVLLAKGKVLCCGSPEFLKKTYNAGSYIQLRKENAEELDSDFPNRITKLLNDKLGGGIHSVQQSAFQDQDREIFIALPADKQDRFSKALAILEENQERLKIAKISMMHATLAGIFYQLANEGQLTHESFMRKRSKHSQKFKTPIVIPVLPPGVEKDPNCWLTLTALFAKQILYMRQHYKIFMAEHLTPLLLIIFFIKFCESFVASQPGPTSRLLSSNTYSEPTIPIYLKVFPSHNTRHWISAFDAVVGRSKSRNKYYDSSDQNKEDFDKHLKPQEGSISNYQEQVVVAFSRDTRSYNGLYASNALHSAPIAQNMLTNVLLYLMSQTPPSPAEPYRISTSNHPIEIYTSLPTGTIRDATSAIGGVMFGFLLALMAASNVAFCITERISGVKSLQFLLGVHTLPYWAVNFCCDFAVNFFATILIMGTFYVFDNENVFEGAETKEVLFIIILLYLCWACLPFGYVFSRLLHDPHSGYGKYIIFHILTGSLPEVIAYTLLRNEVEPSNFLNILRFLFLIFPSYGITSAFVHICDQVSRRNFCRRIPVDSQKICKFFEDNTVGIAGLLFQSSSNASRINELEENDIYFRQCCQGYCKAAGTCFEPEPYFTWKEKSLDVALSAIALAAQGLFYLCVLILMESRTASNIWRDLTSHVSGDLDVSSGGHQTVLIKNETSNMRHERDKISRAIEFDEPTYDILLVADITKSFRKNKVLEHVYFSAPEGQVVGIIGGQQSGKTVLMRIISGDLLISRGHILINGINLHKDPDKFHQLMSYCPQINPILDYLTGYQMMELVARLRGIPIAYADIHITKWLELMGFKERDWNKLCKMYPPGMQRQLSCAMTLLGNCSVLMFDEPTLGLEPLDHLKFWHLVSLLQKQNQTIVFTTSSAQECIPAVTKLVILGSKQILDVGPAEEIQEKYANGWRLMVRFKHDISQLGDDKVSELVEALHKFIPSVFSPCTLKEDEDNFVSYDVLENARTLSYMYEQLENVKKQLPDLIDEYFIAEATLDDVIGNHRNNSSLGLIRLGKSGSGSGSGTSITKSGSGLRIKNSESPVNVK